MLLYTAYMMVSVIYFATVDLALSTPVCCFYLLLVWCLSTGFLFWVCCKCHWDKLRELLIVIKIVAQIIMCIAWVSPHIPITVSCCAYCLCLVEYLNWRCCDSPFVVE